MIKLPLTSAKIKITSDLFPRLSSTGQNYSDNNDGTQTNNAISESTSMNTEYSNNSI